MTGFVLLRVRAHRLLLAAALLTVLLTTAVLATLTSFSGAVGDAALRRTLAETEAADAALTLDVPYLEQRDRAAAATAVRNRARDAFGELPARVQSLDRSGPYALPRRLQQPSARGGEDPDLTHLGALDMRAVELTAGHRPGRADGADTDADTAGSGTAGSGTAGSGTAGSGTAGSGTAGSGTDAAVAVAVPQVAADRLGLRPGDELTLANRVEGPDVRVQITGVYRPRDQSDPYWLVDEVGGKGVQAGGYTTYGPLLTHPSTVTSGSVAQAGGAGAAALPRRLPARHRRPAAGRERRRGAARRGRRVRPRRTRPARGPARPGAARRRCGGRRGGARAAGARRCRRTAPATCRPYGPRARPPVLAAAGGGADGGRARARRHRRPAPQERQR